MNWLRRLFGRDRLEHDLDRELRFHVDEEITRLTREGEAPDEARRRALAAFGGLEPMREYARDARGTRWVEDLGRDVRHAGRMMRRNPAFTTTAILSLAVGIGANAALFNVIDALILRPLPIQAPAEVYLLNRGGYESPQMRFSHPALVALRQDAPGAQFAAMTPLIRLQLTTSEGAEFAIGQLVTGNWFDVARVHAAAGRLLTPADDTTIDGHPVAVLSHAWWTRRFGGDPGVVGRAITVNGVPLTVVGIAPADFFGFTVGESPDLWAPVAMQRALRHRTNAWTTGDVDENASWVTEPEVHWLRIVARVGAAGLAAARDATIAGHRRAVEARLEAISDPIERQSFARERLEWLPGGHGISDVRDEFSRPLGVLMATVALVLIVACANLASLLLARSAARQREFSLRLSLGARRSRLVRQLLTESLVLSGLGGLVGLAVASRGSEALLAIAASGPSQIPLDVALHWPLVAFTLTTSVLTGIAFGLAPALRLSRPGLQDALRGAGRVVGPADGRGRLRFGRVLLVAQVAIALLLVTGAGLFLRSFANLVRADAGFERATVVSARIDPRSAGIAEAALPELYRRLIDETRRIPGVTSATLALSGPVTGSQSVSSIVVEGRDRVAGAPDDTREEYVGPAFLETLGIPLVRGRAFGPADAAGAPLVVIVNETFARTFFGDRNPIGGRFGYGDTFDREIVGVVRDARVDGVREDVPRLVYYPLAQHPDVFARNVYARTDGPAGPLKAALARAVAATHGNLAIREVVTLDELAARTVARERLVSQLTGAFAALALGVACLGLFGTLSYAVARRTNEIGVRIALGASPAGVRWLVLRDVLGLIGAGCAAGLAMALLSLRAVGSLLYGLTPADPVTLAGAVVAIAAVGVGAAALPAWRASRVSPVQALRAE